MDKYDGKKLLKETVELLHEDFDKKMLKGNLMDIQQYIYDTSKDFKNRFDNKVDGIEKELSEVSTIERGTLSEIREGFKKDLFDVNTTKKDVFFLSFHCTFSTFCAKKCFQQAFLHYFHIESRHFAAQIVIITQILETRRFLFQH